VEERPSIYRRQPEIVPYSLDEAVNQLRRSLEAAIYSSLHELLDPRRHPQTSLVLEPVGADTHIQDGVTYLTVRYRCRVVSNPPDSPK
jgi:hypothetical protein